MTHPHRRLVATLLGLALLGLTACGGEDDEPPGTGSSPPSTSSSTPVPSPTSTDVSPSIAPAAGVELREQTSSLHAPDGWVAVDPIASYVSTATGPNGAGSLDLIDDRSLAAGTSLEQRVKSAIRTLPMGAELTRLPDVMLGDTPAYHLTYTIRGRTEVNDLIEAERAGRLVTINVRLSAKAVKQDPDLVASVLASFQWVG